MIVSQLAKKVILITGACGQAGQSAVKMFLKKGATVIANDYLAIELFPELLCVQEEYGPQRFLFIQADMTEEAQVKAVISQIDQHFNRLDGSYHNVYTSVEKSTL